MTNAAPSETRFEFGRNWEDYSRRVLDEERLAEATRSLEALLGSGALAGKRFLDIGSGTGLFSIAAARLGAAAVTGLDVDPRCVAVARANAERFCAEGARPRFEHVSILDDDAVGELGMVDVVYAWGSLHHTGAMRHAIDNAARCVAPGGRLALAIYNRHITSGVWRAIKWLYNHMPRFVQWLMVWGFAAVLYAAKLIVTRRNPLRKRRGMAFMVDVVDWIGGYPYEVASRDEMEAIVSAKGFTPERFIAAPVPTGCNEFVFARNT